MSVIIPADATDAFSHLFMVGLASILEDADAEVCAFRWKDTLQAFELKTNDGLGIDQMAEAVHAHAKRWSQSLPLTSENDYTVVDKDAKPSQTLHATMSPRLSNLGVPFGWEKLQKDRESAVDAMQTAGDYRYFGALGQPSYWSGKKNKDDLQSDNGASRWEMVTRNQGKEFVRDRLLPLSQISRQDPLMKFATDFWGYASRMRPVRMRLQAVPRRVCTLHRRPTMHVLVCVAWCLGFSDPYLN